MLNIRNEEPEDYETYTDVWNTILFIQCGSIKILSANSTFS